MSNHDPYASPESDTVLIPKGQARHLTEPQAIGAGRGWGWIADGFGLFRRDPLIWIVNVVIVIAITLVLGLIPLLGSLAGYLLSPIFEGGLMLGCRAQENGEPLKVEHLFAGFKQNTSTLVAVGGLYMLGILLTFILAILLLFLLGGGGLLEMMWAAERGAEITPDNMPVGAMLVVGLLAVTLGTGLLMAVWFAPALVVFHSLGAVEAMKLSFRGCLRNMGPFLLYGLIAILLTIVAILPFGLGLLVMLPTLAASVYVGYQDIFLRRF
jgi:uncharacterized membrane protein